MKSDAINTFLIFILGAVVLLDVLFTVQSINRTIELRTLQSLVLQENTTLAQFQQIQAVAHDADAFNKKNPNPELTRILQISQPKSGK